jgi:RimJ/RimL family protein N-acetyltransferase
LVSRLGFRKEGVSQNYLRVRGRFCDHERWAITREEWPPHAEAKGYLRAAER